MGDKHHIQVFKADEDGNVKRTENYMSETPICGKCQHSFQKDEVAKAERSEVKAGPAKGQPMLILICPECGQRNLAVLPPKL